METENKKKLLSTNEVAELIGKDARTLQNLAKQGVLTYEKIGGHYQFDLYTVIKEYCDHLTKLKKKKISSTEEEKMAEDVRWKRAKADIAELELQELKGMLHSAEDVEDMTTDLVLVIRSSFLALPGKISSELAELETASEISERLKAEIFDILKDLSNYRYDPEEYRKRVRERRGWNRDEQEDE